MATKNQSPATIPEVAKPEQGKAPELLTIETLRQQHKIGRAVFAGVCAANEWKPGKQVSEAEFLRAVDTFVGSPMDGRKPAGGGRK